MARAFETGKDDTGLKITSVNLPDDVYEWLRVNVRNRSEFIVSLIKREMGQGSTRKMETEIERLERERNELTAHIQELELRVEREPKSAALEASLHNARMKRGEYNQQLNKLREAKKLRM